MKKLFLPLTLLTAVYAAVSCSDPNLPESTTDVMRVATRSGDNDEDDDDNGEKIRCASMEVLSERLRDEPGLWERMEWIEKLTQRFAERRTNPNSAAKGAQIEAVSTPYDGKVTIPVVVHVVYRTAQQNISDAQIQSQINVLNKDFRKTNPDVSQTPGAFAPLASDMNIEFILAGIDRKYSSKTSWGTRDDVKYANKGGVNAVSPSTTLNIWVCNIGNGILGYAQFPGGKAATDGVVIGPQYFGTSDAANNFYLSAPYDKGRTATHEIGHWLNLRHIWGDARCGNDLVADTPTQRTSNGGCPVFPHVTCSNGPNGDMFMNYMDYTYDRCMYLFTEGQKVRSRALFASDGVRRSFVPVQ